MEGRTLDVMIVRLVSWGVVVVKSCVDKVFIQGSFPRKWRWRWSRRRDRHPQIAIALHDTLQHATVITSSFISSFFFFCLSISYHSTEVIA